MPISAPWRLCWGILGRMKGKRDAAQKNVHATLYRMYRPYTFDEVRGQEPVVSALSQEVKDGRVAHAYLFAGGRGTGKTSVARILSRALGVSDKDVYEIDAASNRGIDDVRELRAGVYAAPFESPYKVYIIDEAHMLTKEAWNALLKTLEEPPAHAIFILATTERHKVPETISSRCEVYLFAQPSREVLSETVRDVAKKEGYAMEKPAAELVALLAEGSFRDALGILQKVCTVSHDKNISVGEVESVSGAPRAALVREILEGVARRDVSRALAASAEAARGAFDARTLLKLLMQRVRIVLLARHAPSLAGELKEELSDDDWALAESLAKDKDAHIASDTLRAFLSAYAETAYAAVPYLPLELAIIDVCTPRAPGPKSE